MESFCYRTYPSFIISTMICPVKNVGKDKLIEGGQGDAWGYTINLCVLVALCEGTEGLSFPIR